jgi:hypothetical protein
MSALRGATAVGAMASYDRKDSTPAVRWGADEWPQMAHPSLRLRPLILRDQSFDPRRLLAQLCRGWDRDRLASQIRFGCSGCTFISLGPISVEQGEKV